MIVNKGLPKKETIMLSELTIKYCELVIKIEEDYIIKLREEFRDENSIEEEAQRRKGIAIATSTFRSKATEHGVDLRNVKESDLYESLKAIDAWQTVIREANGKSSMPTT